MNITKVRVVPSRSIYSVQPLFIRNVMEYSGVFLGIIELNFLERYRKKMLIINGRIFTMEDEGGEN